MGRNRLHTDPREPLPPGLYKKGRQFRARRLGGPWCYFGTDYVDAMAAFAAWRQQGAVVHTVDWLLNQCVGTVWPARERAGKLAKRTRRDYVHDSEILRKGLGPIPLAALEPRHIAKFRDARAESAPAHVRNELACLSAALTWAVEDGHVATNVALQVTRPTKGVRDRLISDDEYLAVYEHALASVRLAMTLSVRTLGLPADVLRMGPRNLVKYDDGRRTLRFARGKTGVKVEIDIVGELAAALEPFIVRPTLHPTFVRCADGTPYTVDGIGAMFRRSCVKAKVKDFGLRDLRAKGATEMYRANPDSIHQIQLLLGHKSVRTTEIYLKQLLAEIVQPNMRAIVAAVK